MRNKNKWLYDFNDLEPNYQLEIAEAIVEELKDNESYLDDDEYNKEKSRIIRNFFIEIISKTEEKNKLNEYNNLLLRFKSLLEANKEKASNEIFKVIKKYINIEEQSNKERICLREGHKFSKWQHHEWTDYETTCIDHEIIENYPVKNERWIRTCKVCGYEEKTNSEPKSITYARNRKDKQKRIEELEKELKKLKRKKN